MLAISCAHNKNWIELASKLKTTHSLEFSIKKIKYSFRGQMGRGRWVTLMFHGFDCALRIVVR